MTNTINELIGELQTQIEIMNESDLKGELSDKELKELKQMKIKLKEIIESSNEL